MPQFAHKHINRGRSQFRLLSLRRQERYGKPTTLYAVEFFSLGSPPPYRAISYHWGPPSPTSTILINGAQFIIRKNLADFLQVLTHQPDAEGYYWIDQICIDQDNIKERNHQVKLMRDIFRSAFEVVVWLGASDDSSDRAINFIKTKDVSCTKRIANESRAGEICGIPDEPLSDILALFDRPYFHRLWIVQEIILARQVIIMCGTAQLEWDRLKNFFYHALMGREGSTFTQTEFVGQLLLKRSSMTPGNWLTLYDALSAFGRNECHEPRDKIYGLLGIVRSEDQLTIDYSQSVKSVFKEAIHIAIISQEELYRESRRQRRSHESWLEPNFADVDRFISLGTSMNALDTEEDKQALRKLFRKKFTFKPGTRLGRHIELGSGSDNDIPYSARDIARFAKQVEAMSFVKPRDRIRKILIPFAIFSLVLSCSYLLFS